VIEVSVVSLSSTCGAGEGWDGAAAKVNWVDWLSVEPITFRASTFTFIN